jgi:SAM-dependent methyltransferase
MTPDFTGFRDFYATPLGQTAARIVNRTIATAWPSVANLSILGLGFCTPYLDPLRGGKAQIVSCLPPQGGAAYWPSAGPGLTTVAEPEELPFGDCTFDRIVVVHGLELVENRQPVMRELWRVLSPNGRILIAVPNRRGLWARFETTPFGYGSPYSATQLRQLLREHLFVPEQTLRCLFLPPLQSRFLLASAPLWERAGNGWFAKLSGLTLIEASKQIYGLPTDRAPAYYRRRLRLPQFATPQPQPGFSSGTS